eukprot:CFRG4263T1
MSARKPDKDSVKTEAVPKTLSESSNADESHKVEPKPTITSSEGSADEGVKELDERGGENGGLNDDEDVKTIPAPKSHPNAHLPFDQRPNLYPDDDSDDPVVDEMDVLLSQSLAENMYIFQYPLRGEIAGPIDAANQDISCRMKPKQEKVELTIMLDTNRDSYNFARAMEIADLTANDKMGPEEKKEASHFPENDKMDRYWLTSTRNQMNTHYCVGLIDGGKLHLTPIKGILQMRPDMSYLDPKPLTKPGEGTDEAGGPAKAVNVRVQTTREKAIATRKAQEAAAVEDWVELHTTYRDDPNTENAIRKMIGDPAATPITFNQSPAEYIEALSCVNRTKAKFAEDTIIHPDGVKQSQHKVLDKKVEARTNIFNLNETQRMPWVEQLISMLCSAQVISFSQIKATLNLTTPISDDILLAEISRHAWCVHGNWVVKSDLVYPKPYKSHFTGCPSARLRRIRDMFIKRIYTMDNEAAHKPIEDHFAYDPEVLAEDFYPPYIGTHYRDHNGEYPKNPMSRLDRPVDKTDVFVKVSHLRVGSVHDVAVVDCREVLKGVARQVISKGWVLKRPTDALFISEYPEIVAEQNKQISETLAISVTDPIKVESTLEKSGGRISSRKSVSKMDSSNTLKTTGKTRVKKGPTSAELAQVKNKHPALIAHLEGLLAEEGVLSFSAAAKNCKQSSKKELVSDEKTIRSALEIVGLPVALTWWEENMSNSVYVLKTCGDAAQDLLRSEILQLFEKKQVIKKVNLDVACRAKGIEVPATTVFTRIVKEIATKRPGGLWSFTLPADEVGEDEDEQMDD